MTIGLIDIGNSSLKAAVRLPLSNSKLEQNVAPEEQSPLGRVFQLHWLPVEYSRKAPPIEWMSEPDTWVVPHDVLAMKRLIDSMRREASLGENASIEWKVSSVHPTANDTLLECLAHYFAGDVAVEVCNRDIPILIDVDQPDKVGIDRLLAAYAAKELQTDSRPVIVIQAGTAVTIDWIDERGVYCGGAIMPGLTMMLKFMALGTAHLPWIAPPEHLAEAILPGRNTQQAVLAGVTASFAGGIQRVIAQYRDQHATLPEPLVVVSGGDNATVIEAIPEPVCVIRHLVLRALAMLP